jgi:NAD(P)-dependent dehydrogenase (short-subunit alcohol dehydrogenase family)
MSKVWLITGCSTGFGRLLAEKVAGAGDRVVATARRVETLDGLAAAGDRVLRLAVDVTRGETVRRAAAAAHDHFGRIDVLVNNAGYGYFSTQEDGDIDDIRHVFETNVFGLIRMTQAALPVMRKQGGGVIVNLSSVAGRVTFPRSGFYNATKWAVEALSESLHYEVAPFGIRVIVVEPGAYDTDFGPRSAVRSDALSDPNSPYADLVKRWTDAAGRIFPPERQPPIEVVNGIIDAVRRDEPFMRLPFGTDARMLIEKRDAVPDAEFIEFMRREYGFGRPPS